MPEKLDLSKLGLSQEALDARRSVIGGSDATIIMGGDAAKIEKLRAQKCGLVPHDDLSDILPVQMGLFTEPLNIAWFEKKTGRTVSVNFTKERQVHPEIPYMAATLDGFTTTEDGSFASFQAKHVNQFSKEEQVIDYYYPQITHEALACNVRHMVLSVLKGTLDWFYRDFEIDELYASELIRREAEFWDSVQQGRPYEGALEKAEPDLPKERVEKKVPLELISNEMPELAEIWLKNKAAAKSFEDTAAAIKKAIPEDVTEATGCGISVKRSKAGSLTIREAKNEERKKD